MSESSNETWGCLIQVFLAVVTIAGWANHLLVCFNDERWGFLIAGALFFPIGVIHGWGVMVRLVVLESDLSSTLMLCEDAEPPIHP